MMPRLSPRLRCAGVATAATGLAAAAATLLAGQLAVAVAGADAAVVQVCVVALLACTGWGWVATCAVVVQVWRGAPSRGRGVPVLLRRVVLVACGAALAGSLAAPGHSSTHSSAESDPDPEGALTGLPMPERALGPGHQDHRPDTAAVPGPRTRVVVGPGDSLWLIAARDLPPDADAAAISAHWPRVYRVNRAVIGPDPDLIHPGQRLLLPSSPVRSR